MEQYLQRTRLAGLFNRLGLMALAFFLSLLWFVHLWGFGPAAVIAAIAYGVLLLLLFKLFNKRTVDLRQALLRRRIGGEIAVNGLYLKKESRAHFEAALWLSMAYPLTMEKAMESGVLAEHHGEALFISVLCRHDSGKIDCDDLIRLQKMALACRVDKAVVCATAPLSDAAKRYCREAEPPVVVVERRELIRLAGILQPATNEQLVALGRSKKRLSTKAAWVAHVLDANRSKRYLIYGAGLMALYFITRLPYYPVPGVILICLALLSKCYKQKPPSL